MSDTLCDSHEDLRFNAREYVHWRWKEGTHPYAFGRHCSTISTDDDGILCASLRRFVLNPQVAGQWQWHALTHLAFRYDSSNECRLLRAELFPKLISLDVEIDTPERHNAKHMAAVRAFGFEGLTELKIGLSHSCKPYVLKCVDSSQSNVPVDMEAHDAMLFSRCKRLQRLSLHIGIDTPLVAALVAALPRDLKELTVESIEILDPMYACEDIRVRHMFDIGEQHMGDIIGSLPSGLRVISLPIRPGGQVRSEFLATSL